VNNPESGQCIVALASAVSIMVSKELDTHELAVLAEFLGLLRHNLDIIRLRRVVPKIVKHIKDEEEEKSNKKK
jgi:hypothetical protein